MTAGAEEFARPTLLIVIEHGEDEGPGLIGEMAAGIGLQVLRVGMRDPLPHLDRMPILVVMGGPQAVYHAEQRLRDEVALIHDAVTRGLPILGVCLGAQLLAFACGAAVKPGERGQELGLGAITLTGSGLDDPVFAGSGPALPVFHWHSDTFDLPRGSCHLASSDAYVNQAFRLGRAYGLQFHIEMDAQLLDAWSRQIPLPEDAQGWLRQTEGLRRAVIGRWLQQAVDAVL